MQHMLTHACTHASLHEAVLRYSTHDLTYDIEYGYVEIQHPSLPVPTIEEVNSSV
jgi:hypothetical protein